MENFTAGIFTVLSFDGKAMGTGFLVGPDLAVTCAHVVVAADALDGDTIAIQFNGRAGKIPALVESRYWRDIDKGDVAFLRLDPGPEGVQPLRLAPAESCRPGSGFRSFGYARAADVQGIHANGTIDGYLPQHSLLQLQSPQANHGISGGPVLDEKRGVVVGMITKGHTELGRNAETTFATPAELLFEICPEIRPSDTCPYLGLETFTPATAQFFFGREALIEKLLATLRGGCRFLAVFGPSGSGKSSVVKAGLLPALEKGKVPGSQKWAQVIMRPADDPFAQLTATGFDPSEIQEYLRSHPGTDRVVLYIDQFEEMFTSCPIDLREKFIGRLVESLDNSRFILVITMRDDFYSAFNASATLLAQSENLKIENVPATLNREELVAIIERPASSVGLILEEGLTDRIINDLTREGEIRSSTLPLLEFALLQLWEQRNNAQMTHTAYDAFGGVTGNLARWADDAYSDLKKEERPLAEYLLVSLVNPGDETVGLPNTRRRRLLDEFDDSIKAIINYFTYRRLLITAGNSTELVHDALLRHWSRLSGWLDKARDTIKLQDTIKREALEWDQNGRIPAYIIRLGKRLEDASNLVSHPLGRLPQVELEYIEACRKRDRELGSWWVQADVTMDAPDEYGVETLFIVIHLARIIARSELPAPTSKNFSFQFLIDPLELQGKSNLREDYARVLNKIFYDACPDVGKNAIRRFLVDVSAQDVAIQIRIEVAETSPELHTIIWEALQVPDENKSMFEFENIRSYRFIPVPVQGKKFLESKKELNALAVIPPYTDKSPADLDFELSSLSYRLAGIPTQTLPQENKFANLENLIDHFNQGNPPELLYLLLRAEGGNHEFALLLQDANGTIAALSAINVLAGLRSARVLPKCVVVIAEQASTGDAFPLVTFALELIKMGSLSVLLVHHRSERESLTAFMADFSATLQKTGHVGKAYCKGYQSLAALGKDLPPVLFTQQKSGRLWYEQSYSRERGGFSKLPSMIYTIKTQRVTPILGPRLSESITGSSSKIVSKWKEFYKLPEEMSANIDLASIAQYLVISQDEVFTYNQYEKAIKNQLREMYPEYLSQEPATRKIMELIDIVGAGIRQDDPYESHRMLSQLPLPIYITTSLDHLLESALKEAGREPALSFFPWNEYLVEELANNNIFDIDPTYRPTAEHPLVYHLFGTWDNPGSILLTPSDHSQFSTSFAKNIAEVPDVIRRALVDSSLMWLGFDWDERAFQTLTSSLLQNLSGFGRRSRYAQYITQIEQDAFVSNRLGDFLKQYFFSIGNIELYWGSHQEFLELIVRYFQERALEN